ncbi:EF-hand domain-containing protein [Nonomuraea sp. NPDC059194]|uniref:EF-hand domain-containing protein n=1 Tax=Nonomuraea sp. NPDC059194 TaxID=3346764 RepID=UPI00369BBCD3
MSDYAITFDLVDGNNDGLISAEELVRLMEVLGQPITLDAARAGVARLDRDGDGLISLEEFGTFIQ